MHGGTTRLSTRRDGWTRRTAATATGCPPGMDRVWARSGWCDLGITRFSGDSEGMDAAGVRSARFVQAAVVQFGWNFVRLFGGQARLRSVTDSIPRVVRVLRELSARRTNSLPAVEGERGPEPGEDARTEPFIGRVPPPPSPDRR